MEVPMRNYLKMADKQRIQALLELGKARIIAEAEMAVQGYQQLDIDTVRSYVIDLRKLLDESEVAQRKAFLRSFIKKIVVDKDIVKLYYHVPVPPDDKLMETVGILPIDTPSGDRGIRTPNLRDANAALSQLSYIPVVTRLLYHIPATARCV
jgi:hypothetical protein